MVVEVLVCSETSASPRGHRGPRGGGQVLRGQIALRHQSGPRAKARNHRELRGPERKPRRGPEQNAPDAAREKTIGWWGTEVPPQKRSTTPFPALSRRGPSPKDTEQEQQSDESNGTTGDLCDITGTSVSSGPHLRQERGAAEPVASTPSAGASNRGGACRQPYLQQAEVRRMRGAAGARRATSIDTGICRGARQGAASTGEAPGWSDGSSTAPGRSPHPEPGPQGKRAQHRRRQLHPRGEPLGANGQGSRNKEAAFAAGTRAAREKGTAQTKLQLHPCGEPLVVTGGAAVTRRQQPYKERAINS
ncbi:hypothetical protein NDU88_005314 [Pleurodeles waltl]|uniref:Uncharacterized protein n=1 Tax=Pleurodeles waltl TaxID=8319 RepID=A0AAV7PF60_PLEWA|nr:hypothetical protein NDU88_005314 [Pleurodeles waltl]